MADKLSTRITFSCPNSLRDNLTKQAEKEGIPRSQLIVEILENAIVTENQVESRNPAVNRLIFDIQKRLSQLEGWRREIQVWCMGQSGEQIACCYDRGCQTLSNNLAITNLASYAHYHDFVRWVIHFRFSTSIVIFDNSQRGSSWIIVMKS